jgi:hypothetical protein
VSLCVHCATSRPATSLDPQRKDEFLYTVTHRLPLTNIRLAEIWQITPVELEAFPAHREHEAERLLPHFAGAVWRSSSQDESYFAYMVVFELVAKALEAVGQLLRTSTLPCVGRCPPTCRALRRCDRLMRCQWI